MKKWFLSSAKRVLSCPDRLLQRWLHERRGGLASTASFHAWEAVSCAEIHGKLVMGTQQQWYARQVLVPEEGPAAQVPGPFNEL